MKLLNTLKTISFVLLLSYGCNDSNQLKINDNLKVIREPIPAFPQASRGRAFNGSEVIVQETADGKFYFYRDSDNDGFADTKGSGFYMMGLARLFDEDKVCSGMKMDSLFKLWKSEEPSSSGKENITLENLLPIDLKQPLISDKYLSSIHLTFKDNVGLDYEIVHVHGQKYGDYVFLTTVGNYDKSAFESVKNDLEKIIGEPAERTMDRIDDIATSINVDTVTANAVYDWLEDYQDEFKDVRITTAYYGAVPVIVDSIK